MIPRCVGSSSPRQGHSGSQKDGNALRHRAGLPGSLLVPAASSAAPPAWRFCRPQPAAARGLQAPRSRARARAGRCRAMAWPFSGLGLGRTIYCASQLSFYDMVWGLSTGSLGASRKPTGNLPGGSWGIQDVGCWVAGFQASTLAWCACEGCEGRQARGVAVVVRLQIATGRHVLSGFVRGYGWPRSKVAVVWRLGVRASLGLPPRR